MSNNYDDFINHIAIKMTLSDFNEFNDALPMPLSVYDLAEAHFISKSQDESEDEFKTRVLKLYGVEK